MNEKTQVLRAGLEDKEDEVNFFRMLPLPLFAFAASWLVACLWAGNIPPQLAPLYTRCCYAVFAAALLLAVVYAYHLTAQEKADPQPPSPGGKGAAVSALGRSARLEQRA